jgi:hypothetical protein
MKMTSNGFLNEYIEKKLIKAEKIGIDQIEKIIKAAEKNLKVAEKLLLIDEGVAYETAYVVFRDGSGGNPRRVPKAPSYLMQKSFRYQNLSGVLSGDTPIPKYETLVFMYKNVYNKNGSRGIL